MWETETEFVHDFWILRPARPLICGFAYTKLLWKSAKIHERSSENTMLGELDFESFKDGIWERVGVTKNKMKFVRVQKQFAWTIVLNKTEIYMVESQ